MLDYKKLDSFFENKSGGKKTETALSKHTKIIRRAKLLLPCLAAAILGLLLIFPQLKQDLQEIAFDITKPQSGELEKLHVQNTVFYITDKNNQVHNFTAENIDETEPGSKLVKIINPEGIIPFNLTEWFNVKSPTGYYNQTAGTLLLDNNIEIFYSEGMDIRLKELTFDFNENRGYSNSKVTADGFLGKLNSEGLEIFSKTGVLIFTGKTHLIIKPEAFKRTSEQ